MNITNYMTKRYGDILGLFGTQKQSQTNPISVSNFAAKIKQIPYFNNLRFECKVYGL
jgi:hypothetical protein